MIEFYSSSFTNNFGGGGVYRFCFYSVQCLYIYVTHLIFTSFLHLLFNFLCSFLFCSQCSTSDLTPAKPSHMFHVNRALTKTTEQWSKQRGWMDTTVTLLLDWTCCFVFIIHLIAYYEMFMFILPVCHERKKKYIERVDVDFLC